MNRDIVAILLVVFVCGAKPIFVGDIDEDAKVEAQDMKPGLARPRRQVDTPDFYDDEDVGTEKRTADIETRTADIEKMLDELKAVQRRSVEDEPDDNGEMDDMRVKREAEASVGMREEKSSPAKKRTVSTEVRIEKVDGDSVFTEVEINPKDDESEEIEGDTGTISVVDDEKEVEAAETDEVIIDVPIEIAAETGASTQEEISAETGALTRDEISAETDSSARDEIPAEASASARDEIYAETGASTLNEDQKAAINLHIHKEPQKGSINVNIVKDPPRKLEPNFRALPPEAFYPQPRENPSFLKEHGYIVIAVSIIGTAIVLTLIVSLLYCIVRGYPRGRVTAPKA